MWQGFIKYIYITRIFILKDMVSKLKTFIGLIVWFPFTIYYFILSIPYGICIITSNRIKDKDSLENTISHWCKILKMLNSKIMSKIDIKANNTSAKQHPTHSKEYIMTMKPSFLSDAECTVIHELLHIKYGHCDLPDESNFLFEILINLVFDIIVNLRITSIWIRKNFAYYIEFSEVPKARILTRK